MSNYVIPQLHGAAILIFQAAELYAFERVMRYTYDFWPVALSAYGLVTIGLGVSFWTLWRSPRYRNQWFLGLFILTYLSSGFDLWSVLDLWCRPNNFLLREYFKIPASHAHSMYSRAFIYYNASVLLISSSIALHREYNGLPFRSFLLFSSATLTLFMLEFDLCVFTSQLPLHVFIQFGLAVLVVPYGVLLTIALIMPKDFIFTRAITEKPAQKKVKILSSISLALWFLTALIFFAKCLILLGVQNVVLNIIRVNDPALFVNDVEKSVPPSIIHMGLVLLVGTPMLAVFLWYHVQHSWRKPTFLWDLATIQAGLVCYGQWFFIFTPLCPETPIHLRIKGNNLIFWIINLIPVLACVAQSASLLPYKVNIDPERKSTAKKFY